MSRTIYQSSQERCACIGECGQDHGRALVFGDDDWTDERCTCDALVHLRQGWYCLRCAIPEVNPSLERLP